MSAFITTISAPGSSHLAISVKAQLTDGLTTS